MNRADFTAMRANSAIDPLSISTNATTTNVKVHFSSLGHMWHTSDNARCGKGETISAGDRSEFRDSARAELGRRKSNNRARFIYTGWSAGTGQSIHPRGQQESFRNNAPTESALFRAGECEMRSLGGHAPNTNRSHDEPRKSPPDSDGLDRRRSARWSATGREDEDTGFPLEFFVGTARRARVSATNASIHIDSHLSFSHSLFSAGELARLRNFRFGLIQFRRSSDSPAETLRALRRVLFRAPIDRVSRRGETSIIENQRRGERRVAM